MFSNRKVWVYDIETAINNTAASYLQTADLGYDARLKDPAKIEASKVEKREAAMEKAALSWWYGRIVSIATCDFDDGQIFCWCGDDEEANIRGFLNHIHAKSGDNIQLMGKNSSTFDDGYLVGRLMANNMGVPMFLRRDRQITDIDQIFSMKAGSATLGKLSDYWFGLTGCQKEGSGADVAEMVRLKDWESLKKYNMNDVLITEQIYGRYCKDFVYGNTTT